VDLDHISSKSPDKRYSMCVQLTNRRIVLENEHHMTDIRPLFDPPHDYVDKTIHLLFFDPG
jgi:hypothetical protein